MNLFDYVFKNNRNVGPVSIGGRYQLFRQNHNGLYVVEQHVDFSAKAVDMFLRAAPLFEGGEIRLWDSQAKRLVAAIEWKTKKTEFGFYIHVRSNIFYDRVLASIARQIRGSERIVGIWDDEGESGSRRHVH